VYHGYIETVGSEQLFVTEIDGKEYAGGFGSDGTFYSADGTVVVPPDSPPEFGVTDPATGQFIQGGTWLLADMISQLEQSYQNYVATENANTQNLSA